jgi:hypothetical protein
MRGCFYDIAVISGDNAVSLKAKSMRRNAMKSLYQ